MEDKLKEIRDGIVKLKTEGSSHTIWWENKVGQIQSETYQLARAETIKEILNLDIGKFAKNYIEDYLTK